MICQTELPVSPADLPDGIPIGDIILYAATDTKSDFTDAFHARISMFRSVPDLKAFPTDKANGARKFRAPPSLIDFIGPKLCLHIRRDYRCLELQHIRLVKFHDQANICTVVGDRVKFKHQLLSSHI